MDLQNALKDDKEMAINDFRSARITEAIENGKDMAEKVENLSTKFDSKTCFFWKHMKRQHNSIFFSLLISFFNYPSLPNASQPDYGRINLIILFKVSVILLLIRRKNS